MVEKYSIGWVVFLKIFKYLYVAGFSCMKILKKNLRLGRIVVAVHNLDDLWHLSQVVEFGDVVRGKTTRKVKASEKEASRKTVTLSIRVERVDFKERCLRLNGVTVDEMDDVPKGSHHALSVEEGYVLEIVKKSWPRYHLKRLEQAVKRQDRSLIMIFDREDAVFAMLKSQGYEVLARVKGKVAKKGVETVTGNFYGELWSKLEDYFVRLEPEVVVVASPAFWKEEFMREFKGERVKRKIVLATCSSVSVNAIEEVMKRPELKVVLKRQRAVEESRFVERLMAEIGKDGLAGYGKKEVEVAVASGNVRQLLVTDGFIRGSRGESEALMKSAELSGGEVVIVNSENESGKKLDSLGGAAALLRYLVR